MGWANRAIALLREGQPAVIRPHGGSMRPRVMSGARVTLEPVAVDDLQVDNIVLCRVGGNVYLHLVTALQGGRVQIGNNQGRINGWTKAVYGRAVTIENP
ncbi:MAG: hypothetical protein KTR31_24495 [Myxococcales bacterium]|nr:hypothetical protein [Myxococcales bacterium]